MIQAIICVFVLSLASTTAQEQQPKEEFYHHQLGAAGTFTPDSHTYGLSYLYKFSDNYRIKLTGLYWKEHENDYRSSSDERNLDEDKYFFIDVEGQRTLIKREKIRIYGFLAFGYKNRIGYSLSEPSNIQSRSNYYQYMGSTGLGLELLVVGRIALSVDSRLVYQFESRKYQILSLNPLFEYNTIIYDSAVNFGIGGGLTLGYQF
jgi:hypothetical protein